MLQRLDPELVAALTAVKSEPHAAGRRELLKHVRARWVREVGHICGIIDDISDPIVFTEVTGMLLIC